ncbi:MAG TPA: hypothetical protein VK750_05030 [Cytophagaceae bacterium]|jgi:hypothetical protein|nr:hypothetical protein [Cytophagaceae bacterium]
MKKLLIVTTAACLTVFMVACSKTTKDVLQGSWSVARLTMAGAAQDPELFGPFVYELNGDGSYNYTEGTKKESGKWSVSEDQRHLEFEPASGTKYTKDIKSASKDSVVLSFKSFTMDVNHVLVPEEKK